jgi:DNA repair ATPase RecN
LEDRQPSLATPIQKQGLATLNQVTLALLDAMNQMNMQMGAGNMENVLDQLQQLVQNQEKLNQMAQQLSQQMRQRGQLPGDQQMLDRMAYEQQLIREATERLAEMAEKMSQLLGDLKGISEEMKAVESKLRKQNLSQEVLDKQKRILTRMLESTKSLQKRESSKKRKGEVAKAIATKPLTPPLDPSLLKKVEETQLGLRSGRFQQIPVQYRQQLEDYFRVLSQQPSPKNQ